MSPRLSIIPAGAVTDPLLEPRDLQVLCLLGRHADKDSGWLMRSQVKMAKELSCGRATVQRSLERLVDAGWVQKKRRNGADADETVQPSASYAYRVILDRDDFAFDPAAQGDSESHAEDASPEEAEDTSAAEGVPIDGHPGAHPERARGAHTYVGTKNGLSERPHLERERDARARDRKARFIVAFEQRWPTSAADDRQRTAYAAAELNEAEEQACLDGIGPFLDELKRLKRKHVPAGWKFIEERRWTLLPQAKAAERPGGYHDEGSDAAKAIAALYAVAGKAGYFRDVVKRPGVPIYFAKPVDPRLLALAATPPLDDWPILDHRQAAAWEDFLRAYLVVTRNRLVDGNRAPWSWPPSVEGKLYTQDTGPPTIPELTDDDRDALAGERTR